MKREYEIVYIFDSAVEEPQVTEHLDRFHELLKDPDTPEPITDINHWGKRTLAYPIKKRDTGYYVVAHFETDTQLLEEFERAIKLDETVLRYLVVINEGLPTGRPDQRDALPATNFEDSRPDGDEDVDTVLAEVGSVESEVDPDSDAEATPAESESAPSDKEGDD